MSIQKKILPEIGEVIFQKRRGTRHIRLHIRGSEVKVVMPKAVPYSLAVAFVNRRKKWIIKNKSDAQIINDGTRVGKKHTVLIKRSTSKRPTIKIEDHKIIVNIIDTQMIEDPGIQDRIRKKALQALADETHELIIPRLKKLSDEYGLPYNHTRVKALKSRWGSCDSKKNITLNAFMSQLPMNLIDYILLHELAHTKYLNHSENFWALVEKHQPNYRDLKKQLKSHQALLIHPL